MQQARWERRGHGQRPAPTPSAEQLLPHRRHSRAFRQDKRNIFRIIILFGKKRMR